MEEEVVEVADWGRLEQLATNPWLIRLLILVAAIVIILTVTGLVRRALNKTIKDTDRKYRARKAVTMIAYLVIVLAALMVYSEKLGNIGVALGVAGAGVAFALQEVIVSVAGWLTIILGGSVSVGNRVKIGDIYGDIIDIGVFRTTIMEMGDWVRGDLYNGRIVSLSNGFVYKENVHNYSAEYPFLWDEMELPVRFGCDHDFTHELCMKVLNEVCGDYTQQSTQQWRRLTNRYRVEPARVEPMVSLRFDENWITFTMRYIVDFKLRRAVKDRLSRRLLEEMAKFPDKLQIASSAIEVTHMNPPQGD